MSNTNPNTNNQGQNNQGQGQNPNNQNPSSGQEPSAFKVTLSAGDTLVVAGVSLAVTGMVVGGLYLSGVIGARKSSAAPVAAPVSMPGY